MEDAKSKKKGRQKIPMRRIESEEDRLVTFSKRRSGIYKKATEISTLCATEVGIMMFSPAGKPFSYGIPNIETITSRLMNREGVNDNDIDEGGAEAFRRVKMEDLNTSCDELTGELQILKNEGAILVDEVKEKLKESNEQVSSWWWDKPVADLNAVEMEQMIVTMEGLKKSDNNRLLGLAVAGPTSSSSNPNPNPVNEMGMVPIDSGKIPGPSTAFHDPYAFGFNYGNEGS